MSDRENHRLAIAIRAVLAVAVLSTTALISGGEAHAVPSCKPGWEQNGALCYPNCRAGYKGVGPVCWYQGQKSYGRGAGYTIFPWDKKKCFSRHGSCEKSGLLWYPKCRAGFNGVGPVCWSRNPLSYGRGVGKPLETVKKWFKDTGEKIKAGFKKAGEWMKKNIFDKIVAAFNKFGQKLLDVIMGKGMIGGVIEKAIISLTKKVGFNTADIKEIVGNTGRITRENIRKVVLNKLVVQYLQPLIIAQIAKLIDKGLKFVQKGIDLAVGVVIGGVGSIPFVGGVLAAALSAAYSFGMDKLRAFVAKLLGTMLVKKFITPIVHKGLEWVRSKWRGAAMAMDQLFKSSYAFFDTYVRLPGSAGAARPAPVPVRRAPFPRRPVPAGVGHRTNLSQGKPATQSTTAYGGQAMRAVDGKTSGLYNHRSVTHTGMENAPWWQVDLGRPARIDEIKIFNRGDCCSERLSNFVVLVANQPFPGGNGPQSLNSAMQRATWKQVYGARVGPGQSANLKVGQTGRYVRVQLRGRNYLSLAEVQVFGRGQ